jgi:peptidoglycan/LPS O-acetylase OafA/YrhL
MVMVFHQAEFTPETKPGRVLGWFTHLGGSGVSLFFVISGFLITGILLASKGAPHYYRNFYARRALRIFPLYYAVLFAAFYVMPRLVSGRAEKWAHVDGWNQLWYWSYLSNWYLALKVGGARHGMVDLSWSLSIEEQFYLVWPLVVSVCSRRQLLGVCAGLIAAAPAARLAVVAAGLPEVGAVFLTPSQFDVLGVGGGLAVLAHGGRDLGRFVVPARWAAAAASAALIACYFVGLKGLNLGWLWRPWLILSGSVFAALYGAMLVLAVAGRPGGLVRRVLAGWPLAMLGGYSYALYLFHSPIQRALRERVVSPEGLAKAGLGEVGGVLAFCILATLPAVACAWVSWRVFERPILRLKRYFPSGRPAAVRGATTTMAKAEEAR